LGLYNPTKIMESLDSLPTSVSAAYRRLLDRATDHDFVFKILSWLYHAKRPLRMDELCEAVIVEPGDNTLTENLPAPEMLIECCQGLIVWEQSDDSAIYWRQREDTVRLLHSTVKDFLDNDVRDKLRPVNYITEICLTYLNFDDFEEGNGWYRDHKLANFAASYWYLYMKGEGETNQQLQTLFWTLLASRMKRQSMLGMHSSWGHLPLDRTSLHILALYGLSSVYQSFLSAGEKGRLSYLEDRIEGALGPRNAAMLIAEMENVSAQDSDGMTALHYAVGEGNKEVMELLVSNGADVNAVNQDNGLVTVLHWAAVNGKRDVMKRLLEHGADVEAKAEDGWNVLHFAAQNSQWEVVKWLVGHGVDVEAKEKYGQTILHFAARNNEWEVVKWLVERGANVNAIHSAGRGFRTVLDLARMKHDLEMVDWLIGHGAADYGVSLIHMDSLNVSSLMSWKG